MFGQYTKWCVIILKTHDEIVKRHKTCPLHLLSAI
ncbi:hypothetical protein SACOL0866 [Staphylococcus aureus subsp. aureus COL]|uniref:Uncharacterized protein n=1 Tax=Staphylococcus aureus (strain COL) TaxID=93062 RepID=A0A0H2WVF9_STAAC|nr:hypothetical protein SACOL0866 [Staphylococcus aureus subsp. aureus COL]ACY10686.1 hypothetical protein SAAV_0768 [Staphylococcus aureus subsp. aureus ED98]EFT84988.1 hypothetical protein CGSSa03_14313 [Staphylococcus aureus subsp. aureus CGS03]EFU26634.1 hypothetical protein CGSSa01_10529 [Staphylococcus aureus subsp. aureus CGS01]